MYIFVLNFLLIFYFYECPSKLKHVQSNEKKVAFTINGRKEYVMESAFNIKL